MSTLYNALSHLHSEVSGIWAFGYIGHLLWDTLLFGALMLGPHNRAVASLDANDMSDTFLSWSHPGHSLLFCATGRLPKQTRLTNRS